MSILFEWKLFLNEKNHLIQKVLLITNRHRPSFFYLHNAVTLVLQVVISCHFNPSSLYVIVLCVRSNQIIPMLLSVLS